MSSTKIIFGFSVTKWGVYMDGEAKASYTPSTPDIMYLPNGDPGFPGDSAELDVSEISIEGKKLDRDDFNTFLDENYEMLLEVAEEAYNDQTAGDDEGQGDYLYEQEKDRKLGI